MRRRNRIFLSAGAASMLWTAAAVAQTPGAQTPGVQTAGAKSLEGAYRGVIVCEKVARSPDILHVPLDMVIRGTAVQFARPLMNWNGTRVVGSELGAGTVDADGKVHLTSSWHFGDTSFDGDYGGTLTASGGTLSGRQSWHSEQGPNGGRMCNIALVPAPKAQPVAPVQQ